MRRYFEDEEAEVRKERAETAAAVSGIAAAPLGFSQSDMANGELALIERFSDGEAAARSQLLLLCVKFLVLHSARLLASMLAAAVLRRHLMVWKIFAPRFIFEGIGFGVSAASTLAGYLCLCRFIDSIAAFYRRLE